MCLFVEEATWLTLIFQFDFKISKFQKKKAQITISYQFAKIYPSTRNKNHGENMRFCITTALWNKT